MADRVAEAGTEIARLKKELASAEMWMKLTAAPPSLVEFVKTFSLQKEAYDEVMLRSLTAENALAEANLHASNYAAVTDEKIDRLESELAAERERNARLVAETIERCAKVATKLLRGWGLPNTADLIATAIRGTAQESET